MTARHDMRVNEPRWMRTLARPIAKADIVRTSVGQDPVLARRLASACRLAARRSEHAATTTQLEALQRNHLQEAADLDAAAEVLEVLS